MAREVYEEANAFVEPGYVVYAAIKIEYLQKLPGRAYPYDYSYLAMYAGGSTGSTRSTAIRRASSWSAHCSRVGIVSVTC